MHDISDKPPLDLMLESRAHYGLGGRWYGIYPALVSDIRDPDGTFERIRRLVDAHDGQ